MSKEIQIKNRATGLVVATYLADEHCVVRRKMTERKRPFRKLTDAEYDALIAQVIAGGRGGKRIEGARLVLTRHLTPTEAARIQGLSMPSISQLVKQLEAALAKMSDRDLRAASDPLDVAHAADSSDLESFFE